MSETTIRRARRKDCADIAALFLISSDGLAAYIWGQMDMPGLSLQQIGEQRYAREGVAFSYENCLVAEREGKVVGMLHCFPMEPRTDGDEETDPVLKPYAALEEPDSLYISAIALYPDYRSLGIGTRLLQAARVRARSLGLSRLSLICFDANEGAMRLYRRHSYRESDRRPIVPHPSLHYSEGDAVLLLREAV